MFLPKISESINHKNHLFRDEFARLSDVMHADEGYRNQGDLNVYTTDWKRFDLRHELI